MYRSTILALALAAVEASALLTKRDSTPADTITEVATATAPTVTDVVTATAAASSSSPSPNDDDDSDEYQLDASVACYPRNATGSPDFNGPCNQVAAIEAQCSYGPKALEFLSLPGDSDDYPDFNDSEWQLQSPETERTCICQSQITDATLGCLACMEAHKVSLFSGGNDFGSFVQTMMAQYCNTSYTPTQSFLEFSSDAEESAFGGTAFGEDSSSEDESSSSSYASDPIGTATDVSLYYTMSVTRSDAYNLALPTASNGNVTFTSTRTSDGEIVPTAEAARESGSGSSGVSGSGSGSKDSASNTSSADSGAATAHAGAAGLLAIAALAAVGL